MTITAYTIYTVTIEYHYRLYHLYRYHFYDFVLIKKSVNI